MISIVMPTYNQSKFILQAIYSILNQSYKQFHLYIVDDCSTDDTNSKIYDSGIMLDKRVRYFYLDKNGGTGNALNFGFRMARKQNKYETWFASDNVMYPQALERLISVLDENENVDFVYGNCEIGVMDQTGLNEIKRKNLIDEVGSQDWDYERLFQNYYLGIMWAWRKELREKAGEYQIEPCEDYDMVLKMAQAGGRFHYLAETLGWFRRHDENLSKTIRSHKPGDPGYYSKLAQKKAILREEQGNANIADKPRV